MAKGMKCPSCGTTMYALEEKDEPKGKYVTYLCNKGTCHKKIKVFESS